MKTKAVLIIFLMTLSVVGKAQNKEEIKHYPLIGEKAPKFKAESTNGSLTFPNDFGKSWKILFSHPADFTPVCTSEILELSKAEGDFAKLDVKFAVLSTDQLDRHKMWIESMKELTYKGHSDYVVHFPIIADPKLTVSQQYGMIHPDMSTTKNVRGVFIIDPKNVIRSIMYYPMEIGRNIPEIERTIMALQKHDSDNVSTPANWNPGDDVIVPYLSSANDFKDDNSKIKDPNVYAVSWYMYMKKDK